MLCTSFIKPYAVKKINPIMLNTIKYNMDNIDWDAYDQLNNNNKQNEPEYRGVIEAPANAETIIYESPEGAKYEISISDLIEADDDNEIKYTSPKKQDYHKLNPIHKKTPQYISKPVAKQRYFIFSR